MVKLRYVGLPNFGEPPLRDEVVKYMLNHGDVLTLKSDPTTGVSEFELDEDAVEGFRSACTQMGYVKVVD